MNISKPDDKKVSLLTAEAHRIEQIAALVHEIWTTGCQKVDALRQAVADPSTTVTEPEAEAQQLVGQLGAVLGALAEAQDAELRGFE